MSKLLAKLHVKWITWRLMRRLRQSDRLNWSREMYLSDAARYHAEGKLHRLERLPHV